MELPACPVETTLMLIGDKWKVLILRDEYTLTETGYSLKPILDSMVVWGSAYQRENGAQEDARPAD